MKLRNPRLEETYTELCALLSERQGEQARTHPSTSAGATDNLEELSAEIEAWRDDASKLEEEEKDEEAIEGLLERARQIGFRLCEERAARRD